MSKPITVEVINIGDELLVGVRPNAHLNYLGAQFSRMGIAVRRASVVPDEASEIEAAFQRAWASADWVIVTGGLGPTADDLTRETIARSLGAELVFDIEVEEMIRARLEALGREMSPKQVKQCYRFAGGSVLKNAHGTAPGLVYRAGEKTLVLLPGPVHELEPIFEEQVIPLIQSAGLCEDGVCSLQLRTCGIGESSVETKLEPLLAAHPDVSAAYCVHFGMVDVRLTTTGDAMDAIALKALGDEARKILGDDFVCFGNCTLAQVVYHELRALDRTLAIAESCTGGALGDAFTDIPGASKVFQGGIICYTNDVKMALLDVPESILDQHGAVSPECAIAMASGAAERLSADYGLSVTGFIGPGGGTEQNPVGTIHFGYHSPVGVWCKTVRYNGSRPEVKARAVQTALDWMRRKLKKYKMEEFLCCGQND